MLSRQDLKPVSWPALKGRRGGQRVQQRQVPSHRRHDADARIGVAESGVDVHAPGEQAPDGVLKSDLEVRVAVARGRFLLAPRSEGMGGRGDDGGAVAGGGRRHDAPGFLDGRADFLDRVADPTGGFDLGAEKLGRDSVLAGVVLALRQNGRIGIGDQVAGCRIDQEEFLFDPQRDRQIVSRHVFPRGRLAASEQIRDPLVDPLRQGGQRSGEDASALASQVIGIALRGVVAKQLEETHDVVVAVEVVDAQQRGKVAGGGHVFVASDGELFESLHEVCKNLRPALGRRAPSNPLPPCAP